MKMLMKFLRTEALRFTLPVIGENLLTSGVSLVYAAVLGGVSASSLASAGTGNYAMSFIVSVFNVVISGSAILVSRLTGQGDRRATTRIVENTMIIAPAVSFVFALALFLVSSPVMRILMPGADDAFFGEGLQYFRMMLLSLPGLIAYNALIGILRASGDSKAALIGAFTTNGVQLLSAVLFIKVLKLEILGAGLAYVVCRYAGAIVMYIAAFRHHRSFSCHWSGVMKPTFQESMRIIRVGLPSAFDSLAVQGGYLLINTLLVGLGQRQASVYNVLYTIFTFVGICQGISSAASTTLVGHKVGSGDLPAARRLYRRILLIALSATVVLNLPFLLYPSFFTGIFTGDAEIRKESASLIWVLIMFCMPAVFVNASEPAARVGGELKSIMLSSIVCVWAVRVPLTWLFCYPMDLGVMGVFLANTIACSMRAAVAYWRIHIPKWGMKNL